MLDTPTPEEIAQHYSACLDSVNVINRGKQDGMPEDDWQKYLNANKEHLKIMLAKDFWTTEDLEPLRSASQ
jgi:hypothetical protein